MPLYTTRNKVKDLLLSRYKIRAGGTRIDFSESYRSLAPGSRNQGSISLSQVDFNDSWAGISKFLVTFSDATNFTVTYAAEGNEATIDLGAGTVGGSFTATNTLVTPNETIFTIDPSYWSGTAQAGDVINFTSLAIMSNDVLDGIIEDSEVIIDNLILRSGKITKIGYDRTKRYFNQGLSPDPIPSDIALACERISLVVVFNLVNPDVSIMESPIFFEHQQAVGYVENYVESLPYPGPQYLSRAPIASPMSADDKIGTPFLGIDLDWDQRVATSIRDIISRNRNYTKNTNYVGFQSTLPPYP